MAQRPCRNHRREKRMSKIVVTSSYQAVCNCGNPYGDPSDNEMEAVQFTREFPTCADCDVTT